MPGKLIGLIELEGVLGWESAARTNSRFSLRSTGYANRIAADSALQAEFEHTASIEADVEQLLAELEGEYVRLKQNLRAA